MKRLPYITICTFTILGCSNIQNSDKNGNKGLSNPKVDSVKNVYADSGQSSFSILTGDSSTGGYDIKTVETTYKVVFIASHSDKNFKHYFAKYTTTSKTCTGCEEQQRNIHVELGAFDNPQKTAFIIDRDCDDLTLDGMTYKTVKYGCCGAEDKLQIFDYGNKSIIEGDSKIITGLIPNSSLKFYVAFKPDYKDTTTLGTLYYAYNSSDSYAIKIKSKLLSSEDCFIPSSNVIIYSANSHDKLLENNEYEFWSLNNIKTEDLINNITLKFSCACYSDVSKDTLEIPIINGKPFGKDERQQVLTYTPK
ncbi:hypothetical protein [Pedobacter sp.]|jgi:hypothetical protein|uniref:hypothetical protein n=1 Tax=Pedobacter sp. TaxID=1411316 RepID=UPI002C595E88|nr:hypothetical protein [Pedobacter sp.]HWW41410.1 hypothetical protein [Pedobacter sp.]